jgi:hypothetical protein
MRATTAARPVAMAASPRKLASLGRRFRLPGSAAVRRARLQERSALGGEVLSASSAGIETAFRISRRGVHSAILSRVEVPVQYLLLHVAPVVDVVALLSLE